MRGRAGFGDEIRAEAVFVASTRKPRFGAIQFGVARGRLRPDEARAVRRFSSSRMLRRLVEALVPSSKAQAISHLLT